MKQTHTRLVTNAFLVDFYERNDRAAVMKLPDQPRPNMRSEAFRYASFGAIAARLVGYGLIGLMAMGTGAAIVIIAMRVLA